MKTKLLLLMVILGVVLICAGSAMAYTVDGNLSDWGVDPSIPGAEDWTPNAGIYYSVEDTTSEWFLGPSGGGQLFDAEAMYLTWDDTNLYIALVTGFPNSPTGVLENGKYYSAGDVAIDFGIDGSYEYGLEMGSHSPEYAYPNSWWAFNGAVGGVYDGITWKMSEDGTFPINMHYTEPNPNLAGMASGFAYLNTYYNADPLYDHWVMEASIPRSIFGAHWNPHLRVMWTETCGNDIATAASQETMSIALFGIGALGALFNIRRKSKR